MGVNRQSVPGLLIYFLIILINHPNNASSASDAIGQSTSQIIEARGFQAQDFYVEVEPNVKLNLVKIINPAIPSYDECPEGSGKGVVLFVHGVLMSGTGFVINSQGAKPRDLRQIKAANMTIAELEELLADDPTSTSLPLLLANLGHRVYILNRRPTIESQLASNQRVTDLIDLGKGSNNSDATPSSGAGLTSGSIAESASQSLENALKSLMEDESKLAFFNRSYWNFTIDTQAGVDLPKVIDFILAREQEPKLSIVGHSLGGAIPVMMLVQRPEYGPKISHNLLLSPSVDLGFTLTPSIQLLTLLEPLLITYSGPVLPSMLVPLVQTLIADICSVQLLEDTFCDGLLDTFLGLGGAQLNLQTGFAESIFIPTGALEFAQIIQSVRKGRMHYFDFRSPLANLEVYEWLAPPLYETRDIDESTSISIWQGNTDAVVTPADSRLLKLNLRIPAPLYVIGGPRGDDNIYFNHIGYQYHRQTNVLFNIPALKDLESSSASTSRC